MFKKTVEFEDFDGNKQTKDFYFHISKADLLAMAANGDEMQARIERITKALDGAAILQEFRELIKLAVGVRSEDGQRFTKDAAAQSTLLDSPAFDELLMELATDAGASVEFVQQLIPEKMQKELAAQLKKNQSAEPLIIDPLADKVDNRPAYQKEHRHPTHVEFDAMNKEEMADAYAWSQRNRVSVED
jgi:hypothetical protein